MKHIGFIGLGTMGKLMAATLIQKGYPVTGMLTKWTSSSSSARKQCRRRLKRPARRTC
ncbi:NAD(P)-binding domain-containing protein [Paenibacillus aestuarii]